MFQMFEFLMQGGWPMIPLAVCSLTAVAVIIERILALRHSRVFDRRVLDIIEGYNGETSADTVLSTCHRSHGAFARLLEDVIGARHLQHDAAIETLQATGRREVGHLERGLILLEIVAGISPLIGLLGTVLGMITVFDAITAQGMGNPQVLSDGISKALVTTVAGLCVAIPALAFYSYFSRRVESLAIEMQELSTSFLARLIEAQGRRGDAAQI